MDNPSSQTSNPHEDFSFDLIATPAAVDMRNTVSMILGSDPDNIRLP